MEREVIVLSVRWYLRFNFSFGDFIETMAERGLSLAHTTTMRRYRASRVELLNRIRKSQFNLGHLRV